MRLSFATALLLVLVPLAAAVNGTDPVGDQETYVQRVPLLVPQCADPTTDIESATVAGAQGSLVAEIGFAAGSGATCSYGVTDVSMQRDRRDLMVAIQDEDGRSLALYVTFWPDGTRTCHASLAPQYVSASELCSHSALGRSTVVSFPLQGTLPGGVTFDLRGGPYTFVQVSSDSRLYAPDDPTQRAMVDVSDSAFLPDLTL